MLDHPCIRMVLKVLFFPEDSFDKADSLDLLHAAIEVGVNATMS